MLCTLTDRRSPSGLHGHRGSSHHAHGLSEPGRSSQPDSPVTETLLVWVSSATQGSQTPPDRGEKEREGEERWSGRWRCQKQNGGLKDRDLSSEFRYSTREKQGCTYIQRNLLSVHLHFLSIHLRKEVFTLLVHLPSCKILVKQVQGVQDGGRLTASSIHTRSPGDSSSAVNRS